MVLRRKSKKVDEEKTKKEELEQGTETEQKIELMSSTDPEIKPLNDDLQSEIDLFESEINESIESEPGSLIQPEKVVSVELEKVETLESEKVEIVQSENKIPIEPETVEKIELEKREPIQEEKIETKKRGSKKAKTKTPKKIRAKKSRKAEKKVENKELETQTTKEPAIEEVKEPEKVKKTIPKEKTIKKQVETDTKEELVDITNITNSIKDSKIQASVLIIYNENAELKANLEKAKKVIRILKKKLDLAEEKEEQWRICANSLGDIFAEKSHMPLEDVLRRFEAPLDEVEV